jgi:hypothetical protein
MSWTPDTDEVAAGRAAPTMDISATLLQSGISAAVLNAGTPGLLKYILNTFSLAFLLSSRRIQGLPNCSVLWWPFGHFGKFLLCRRLSDDISRRER